MFTDRVRIGSGLDTRALWVFKKRAQTDEQHKLSTDRFPETMSPNVSQQHSSSFSEQGIPPCTADGVHT